ncbi:MAG: hypothetical protein LBB48_03430 [Treponema sp.]|nr:hypothetical protein [Treponema sp.]
MLGESKAPEAMTVEISGGMREMAAGAEQISTAVMRVNDISAENKRQIETLMREVARFRIE